MAACAARSSGSTCSRLAGSKKSFIGGFGGYSDVFVEALNKPEIPSWYRLLLSEYVIQYWQVAAFLFIGLQLVIGISYVIGYVVRPVSILAVLLCLNYFAIHSVEREVFFKLLIACHIMLAWVGAGRCLGLDYYFFKRRRGLLW